ncbi:MAG: hypothetical protein HY079_08605 [Elusimicrobia bacterium]|nr:hypothetical protein [Elusimicrobiota bacterium]
MKKLLLAAVLMTVAAAANAQVVVARIWDRLEGQHSGIKESVAVAVKDSKQWEEIWRRHDASAPVPEVDFSRESVVVVVVGPRRTAGTKVEIVVQKDPLDGDRLNVFYREIAAPSKSFSAQVQCQPFAIVKIPKAATIDLERDATVSTPERRGVPAQKFDGRKMRALTGTLESPSFDGR